jgi:hypothetical protein
MYGSAMETKGGSTTSAINRMQPTTHINEDFAIRSPLVADGWAPTPTNSGWGASPKDYWAATPTNSPWGLNSYDDYSSWNNYGRPSPSPTALHTNQSAHAAATRLGLVSREQSVGGNPYVSSLSLQSYRPGQTSIPLSKAGSISGENRLSTPLATYADKGKRKGKQLI